MLFYLIIFSVIYFLFLVLALSFLWSILTTFFTKEPPFVPAPLKIVGEMLNLAELKDGETVYDLGCGDGRVVIEAARRYKVKAIGIEKFFGIWLLAKLRNFLFGSPAKILRQDIFKTDLKNADVVFCYLWPETMEKLKEKFLKEMQPKSRIISYDFKIKDWQPKKIKKIGRSTIYFYQI